MVAGRLLVEDYQLLSADEAAVRAVAQEEAHRLGQRVAADPLHSDLALMTAMAAGNL